MARTPPSEQLRAPSVWTRRNPIYLARRWQSRWGNLIHIERITLTSRRAFRPNDCPECVDRFEVGDSSDPRAVDLAERLLGAEAPYAVPLAGRFADEVLAWLPRDRTWTLDGCSIRDWADEVGLVRARWTAGAGGTVRPGTRFGFLNGPSGRAEEHTLPIEDYVPPHVMATPLPAEERARLAVLSDAQRAEMTAVLAGLSGDDF